tara:strand:+ start:1206 stop:2543 length:1338 start_codon:yes stop_codon:yes gene_type:complete
MITIPIEIGDVIMTGKFKNHKVTVQEIGMDDYGLPTVNGKGIMKIRIQKLIPTKEQVMVKEAKKQKYIDYKDDELKPFRDLKVGQEYVWIMGAEPLMVKYTGKGKKGEGYFNFEFVNQKGNHDLSIRDVKEYIKFPLNESKKTSKMKLSEVISKGVFINIKKEDGKFWFYIDTVDGPECISNVGFPTKEAAEHAALTKGFNVKKGGDAEDEMPDTVEVPKPSKRETTKGTEKPKEIDLGKEKEIKLEEQIKRMIRSEIRRVTESFQKKKSLTEGTEITKKIEDSLAQLKDLQDKIASAKAEIDVIMKRTGLKDLEKKSDDILKDGLWDFFEELKKDEQRIVKFQDIVMTVKRFQASPATYEYEKVLDFAMTQVNQDVKAKILAELKASEKIGKTKGQVSFTTEGVGDIWNSLKQLFSRLIPSLKLKGKKIDAGISSAENALKKIR